MHTHHASLGQKIVHQGEDTFLGFTGVGCASNQDQLLAKIHQDESRRTRAIALRLCLETREVNYSEFRLLGTRLLLIANKHCASKERMPGQFSDYSDGESIIRVGSSKGILHKQVA